MMVGMCPACDDVEYLDKPCHLCGRPASGEWDRDRWDHSEPEEEPKDEEDA